MAIVLSHTQFKGKGSLGATYFAQHYGRTIQCQKPGPRQNASSRSEKVVKQESLFGMVSKFMSAHAEDIKKSFNRVKYGSQRNYFYKINKKGLQAALTPLVGTDASISEIENAIGFYAKENPTSIYKVKKTGLDDEFLTKMWDSEETPTKPEEGKDEPPKEGGEGTEPKPGDEGYEGFD